ncbi:MAG: T9SS type A sorting domain-containing protein [bacterium]|nr:MAG: T9SS type A sorting domain-containing protein [bacterium]
MALQRTLLVTALITLIVPATITVIIPAAADCAIVVDGDFSIGEWNPVFELRASNTDVPWGPNNDLVNLYVSWDLSNLYVGVEGYSSVNNVFLIYIDSSTRATGVEQNDYYPGFSTQGEGWDPDFVHAVCDMEAGIGADVRQIQGDGSTVHISGSQNASREGWHNSNGIGGWEITIPWSVIGTEVNGWIRVAAGLGWAPDKFDPSTPLGAGSGDELGADQDSDLLSLDNPVLIGYDEDGNGVPDPIGAGADSVVVRFRFYAPDASTVNLAGDFNGWCNPSGGVIDTAIDPMSDADGDSIWTIDKKLPQSYQEYKFVQDGHIWLSDPLNPDVNPNDNYNSYLFIRDPLVYYLSPMEGSVIGTSRPTVSASIAHSESTPLDLDEIKLYIDDALVAQGPSHYDAVEKEVRYTLVDSLEEDEHELRIAVANTSGAAHADSSIFTVDLDFIPPVIVHGGVVDQPANRPVIVTATITDDEEVYEAKLNYRAFGSGDQYDAPFLEGLENEWYAEIPASFAIAGRTVLYHITASDRINTTRSPGSGEYNFDILADDVAPVIFENFASPALISPDGDSEDDVTRISFRLSEPVYVDCEIRTSGGALVKRLLTASLLDPGYRSVLWDGSDSLGVLVPNGNYRYRLGGIDLAGLAADRAVGDITVDRTADPGKLNVVLLFHANQTLNLQGDTANDVCFNGLVKVLREHPGSKFMLHFSGSLLHDLLWYDFRHNPSTIDMLRAGAADGQFEIVGSTYSQNIPYSTHMWDNNVQIDVQRTVIERSVSTTPVSFWNAERCWKQQLVPLIADNGYTATWVETHILYDSGTTMPEFAVRKTNLGIKELVIFNDDGAMIWLLDGAIDSGYTDDLVDYLSWLHSEDTYRDYVVCYCQDAEATGLWDYEHGEDPQPDWDNLDHVLDVLEGLSWVKLTTFSEYLETRHPTEMLSPIVDGQANWMVGPSQDAGYEDWFDFNENSPLLAFYRDFYDGWRNRVQAAQAAANGSLPGIRLIDHALRNYAAHQFEFGCINCGDFYCQDYHKLETIEASCLAAEYAASPVVDPQILMQDANGDSIQDVILVTPENLFVFSPYGGRLLYWFDLGRGEELVGNELFMWGLYYIGWRDHYTGGTYNDDYHYTVDYAWNAPYQYQAAQPWQRSYGIRKKCFNEFFTFGGMEIVNLLNDELTTTVLDDSVRFSFVSGDFIFVKSFYPVAGGLAVDYRVENRLGATRNIVHRIENSMNPALIEVMDYGRKSLKYYDGSDTTSTIGPGVTGVINVATGTAMEYTFDPAPDDLDGRRDVFALQLNPEYDYNLGGYQTKNYGFILSSRVVTGIERSGPTPSYPFRLHQNYPNPFNPSTRITYSVGRSGPVSLRIYDIAGRLVRILRRGIHEPGTYTAVWNGLNDEGRMLSSGIYFCRMKSADFSETRKLILLR